MKIYCDSFELCYNSFNRCPVLSGAKGLFSLCFGLPNKPGRKNNQEEYYCEKDYQQDYGMAFIGGDDACIGVGGSYDSKRIG